MMLTTRGSLSHSHNATYLTAEMRQNATECDRTALCYDNYPLTTPPAVTSDSMTCESLSALQQQQVSVEQPGGAGQELANRLYPVSPP